MSPTLSFVLTIGAVALALAALALALIGLLRQRALQRRYLRLFGSGDRGAVNDALAEYAARVEGVVAGRGAELERIAALEKGLQGRLQRASVTRFNPFGDTGGDQSFVLVLTDAEGNGAVLSSLHARGLTRVYAKPLILWTSPHQLSAEEQAAVDKTLADQAAG